MIVSELNKGTQTRSQMRKFFLREMKKPTIEVGDGEKLKGKRSEADRDFTFFDSNTASARSTLVRR